MKKIVECVPNFPEGRDQKKIEKIVSVLKDNTEIKLINYEADADYNRTVVTVIGEPEALIDAMVDLTKVCLKEIDLNHHQGEHARMGAIDVIPFIPIANVKMKECVEYAKTLAEKISGLFDIPCFLYAEAAKSEDRIKLPNIRSGEFEGMDEKIKKPKWKPDFGPAKKHPTFGSVAVGARDFLIAYNIDIQTDDEKITNRFARAIRESSGGFKFIQAGPVYLENRGHTQVTMNILNYKKNPIYRIFETVKMEAKRYHYDVPSAEVVGLVPKDALVRSLRYYYGVHNLSFDKDMSIDEVVEGCNKYLMFRDFDKSKIIDFFFVGEVMKTIIHHIKSIYTSIQKPPVKGDSMAKINVVDHPFVVIEDGIISVIGTGDYKKYIDEETILFDAQNTIMVPGLIDAHTHLVFAGSREHEFHKKIAGVPYLEILEEGGGILSTVKATRDASFEELYRQSFNSLNEMMIYGVTSLEVKSGYGLNLETEIKQLKVAKKLNENHPVDIYATYLGAHAIPEDYKEKRDEYVNQIIQDLKTIKEEDLASYVDVFCEVGVFTAKETKQILNAAKQLGYKLRVHTDEIESIGGTKVGIELKAKTVDHLMAINDDDIVALAKSDTIANLLPSTSFFLNKDYAPARKMINHGCAIAISSDYNPGSTPSENYQLTMQIAGNKLRMLPNEVLTAATINPAYSLDIHDFVGTIEVGKKADLLLLDAPNFDYVIYHYGVNHTRAVFKNGKCVVNHRKVVYDNEKIS